MFALKCVLVSHSLVIFGHLWSSFLCLYNCFQSFIHPTPWFAVVTRPNWERRSSVGHHTSRAHSEKVSNKCNILRFSRCSVLLICLSALSSFHGKKTGLLCSAGCCAIVNCDAALCAAAIKAYPVWVKFGGNHREPGRSG